MVQQHGFQAFLEGTVLQVMMLVCWQLMVCFEILGWSL